MKQEKGIKNSTIIIVTIAVVISLFAVRFLISEDLGIEKESNENEVIKNEEENAGKEEIKINIDDPVIDDLIKLLGKSEGSLTISKNIGSGVVSVEELMYSVSESDVNKLSKDIIMYLIINNASIIETKNDTISAPDYGTGFEIGYIIDNSEVQRILYKVFGNNLVTMPKSCSEVGVYYINIDNNLVAKYARFNSATGNIEISLGNVMTKTTTNYLYLNSYDRVEIPDENTLELYEKVIFTSGIYDKENNNGFKLYKDIMQTEYIAKVTTFDLVNGRYRFSEKELSNYINLFAEYKYTFNKDSNGYYHLRHIEKVH